MAFYQHKQPVSYVSAYPTGIFEYIANTFPAKYFVLGHSCCHIVTYSEGVRFSSAAILNLAPRKLWYSQINVHTLTIAE